MIIATVARQRGSVKSSSNRDSPELSRLRAFRLSSTWLGVGTHYGIQTEAGNSSPFQCTSCNSSRYRRLAGDTAQPCPPKCRSQTGLGGHVLRVILRVQEERL